MNESQDTCDLVDAYDAAMNQLLGTDKKQCSLQNAILCAGDSFADDHPNACYWCELAGCYAMLEAELEEARGKV